jgi:hypothetical protein
MQGYEKYLNNEIEADETAWQYLVRQQKAKEEMAKNPYWLDINLSLKDAVVKPIDRTLAKKIIEEYEWLGCMPAVSQFYFGIFFDDICGGVVVFGTEYVENRGSWDSYGYTGKIILLSRGVCLHWTPKNTNSKLVMGAIKMLPEKYEVITATVDRKAGEFGTIYQACNFHYVGAMRKGKRPAFIIDGKLVTERGLRAKFGTSSYKIIQKLVPDAQFVPQYRKERYFLFRKNQKEHLKAIEHLLKPYPKRGLEGA